MRGVTVRARLTIGLLLLITILVGVLTAVENAQLGTFLVAQEATRVRAQAKAAIDDAAEGGLTQVEAVALARDLTSADTGALVLAPDGAVVGTAPAGTIGAAAPASVPPAAVARAAAGEREVTVVRDAGAARELLVFVPTPGSRPPSAVIVLATSLRDEDDTAARNRLIGLAGLLVTLLAATAGSAVLVRRALAPLRRMAATASCVAAGDLAQRTGLTGPPNDEIVQLSAAFDTMAAELETGFAALRRSEQRSREFVADASHELRTPLTSLAGFSDLLLRRLPASERDAVRLAAALRREVDRMQRVVDDLLLLARAEQDVPTRREAVSLAAAAGAVIEQVAPVAGGRTLSVRGADVVALTDPDRLHQILLNLVGNALRHTDDDGHVTFVLDQAAAGGRVVVSVVDDGEGMDEETLAAAFERFHRGSERRGVGAGLGLPIVAALTAALDGRVVLHSEPHRGTTATIELPAPG